MRNMRETWKKKKERISILFLVHIIKSAVFKQYLFLHYMSELVHFLEEAFFIIDYLATQIKILKSKDIPQSVLRFSID